MQRVTHVFPSELRELPSVRALVRDVCRQAWGDCAGDAEVADLELALAEATSNIIRHAYQGEPGRPIELTIEADLEQACVSLYHEGNSFDPALVAPPAFDGSRVGGFGLYLMRKAVEEVTFFSDERGRHGVRLVKKRHATRAQEGSMQTDVEQVEDVTVVAIRGSELDAGNAEDFRQAVIPALKDCRKLIIDLDQVQFVDSSGGGAILSCLKQVRANGGDLKLCNLSRTVRSVFDLMRFQRLCQITETREEALSAFRQS